MSVPPALIDPTLTLDQLAAIACRAYGGEVVLREAVPVGGGSVNEVWRLAVGGHPDTILRIAPSVEAAASGPSWLTDEGLRREQAAIALLPTLAEILPRTVAFDPSRTIVPRDWVVQSIVPGSPWSKTIDVRHRDADRIGLWRQMGTICRTIHDVRGIAFGPAHDPFFATWSELLLEDALGLQKDARRFEIDAGPFDRLVKVVAEHRSVLDRVTTPVLIHSDLGRRHCFVEQGADGGWHIVGLIDLEFARFADPLSESAIELLDLLPFDERFRDAFWAGYGPVDTPPGRDSRTAIYSAISLGWVATDFARQGKHDDVRDILVQLAARLDGFHE